MGNKIIIMKDLHERLKEPFLSAQIDLAEWVYKQEWNNENNYFLQLGDLYHFYNPSPKVHANVIDLFENKLRFKKKIVIAGNNRHEYNRSKKEYVIEAVEKLKNVETDYKPTIRDIEGFKFLTLPWFYDSIHKDLGIMKDYYNSLPEKYSKESYDYIFYHLEDETINFDGEGVIDLSYINTKKRLGGHIHKKQKNYNLGMPILSRYDEKDEPNELLMIDLHTKEETIIKVPKFIDYYEINYGKEIIEKDYEAKYMIFDITNCPDMKKTELDYIEKYKDNTHIYFRKFEVKLSDNESIDNQVFDIKNNVTIPELMKQFFINNKTDKQVQDKIKEVKNNETKLD